MPIDHENSFAMARSVSFSTTLAEVTPYWEPALWVLIVVVTAGIVGSALWAPSRTGRRRDKRKLFRRSDAKARREERTAVAATMVPASTGTLAVKATSDFYADPDVDERATTIQDQPTPAAFETEPSDRSPAPMLYDQASHSVAAPVPPAPVSAPVPVPVSQVLPVTAESSRVVGPVTFADVEAGFARLASDVATLVDQIGFFDERSNVPPEMPTWPIEYQQALAERAAEALADPLDELLEHSLAVASDVRALDRLLGGRFHDEESAQAIVGTRIDLDGLRRNHGRIHQRFTILAGDFDALWGTAEQLAKVASIVDATDAVMGSWQPTMVEAARTASARS